MRNNFKFDNGLELKKIKSMVKPIEPIDFSVNWPDLNAKIAGEIAGDAVAVAYLDYQVLIGRFKGVMMFYNDRSFEPRFLQNLRVFDRLRELYLWRGRNGFHGRLRIDENGDPTHVVDALQVIFGAKARDLPGGYSVLTEDRGTELIVPVEGLESWINDDVKRRVALRSRNYVGQNSETFQSEYIDCRFLGFEKTIPELDK